MDKEEEEEEEEEEKTRGIQLLKHKNQALENERKRLVSVFRQKKLKNEELKTWISVYENGNKGMSFYIERVNLVRQPVWWYIGLVLSFVCMFGSFSKQSYIATLLNVMANKFWWRRLYVQTNTGAMLLSVTIMVLTILYV